MSHETQSNYPPRFHQITLDGEIISYADPEDEPDTATRREFLQNTASMIATLSIGSAAGIGAVEAKRRYDSYGKAREFEKNMRELEEMMIYINQLCDDPESLPWDEMVVQSMVTPEQSYSEYHAEQAGLNLVETEEALFAIEHAQSVDEVIEAFDVFTRQFDAESTLADNWRYPAITPQKRQEVYGGYSDVDILKIRFSDMVRNLSVVPREVFELSGVSSIHFTEFTTPTISLESGDKAMPGATVVLDGTGKINMSLDGVYSGGVGSFTLIHEIGHLLDEQISGSGMLAGQDGYFNDLNDDDFEYAGVIPDEVDVDGFIRAYSAYNILEDKAVLFENMLAGVDYNLARSEDPIVREKYRVQLARLEMEIANIAPYLLTQGYHGGIHPRNPYGATHEGIAVAV